MAQKAIILKAESRAPGTDFLNGKIFLPMLRFTVPILFSVLFQQLYNTVDTLIVGHTLGETSLAAIGAVVPVYDLLIGFVLGFGNGLSIITARCYGADDRRMLKNSAAASIVIGSAVVVVLTILAQIIMMPLLRLLHTPSEIIGEAYRYISIITVFTVVMFAYNLCAGILRAVGNSVMPLVFLVISSLVNILLDYVFIAMLGRGLGGAAEATVIAQGIPVVLCLIYIAKAAPMLIPERENFKVNPSLYKEMTAQGLSMGVMSCLVSAGSVILQSGINGLGYLYIAAHTAARRLYQFCMIPFVAMTQTINTFVSQNYGAHKPERIRKAVKYAYLYSIVMAVIITVLVWDIAPGMIRWISGSDEQLVLRNGTLYLRVVMPFYSVLGVLYTSRTALLAIGEKRLSVLSSVIELIGKIIFTMILIPKLHYMAVIMCEPMIWCVMTAELLAAVRRNPFLCDTQKETDVK